MYCLLENTMSEIYGITKKDVGIVDENGFVLAFSNSKKVKAVKDIFSKDFKPTPNENKFKEYYYEEINLNYNEKCYIFIKGYDKESLNYLKIIKALITKIYSKKNYQQEKEDFLEKMLTNDVNYKEIETNIKKYDMKLDLNSVVFLITVPKKNFEEALNLVKKFLNSDEDYVLNINFLYIAVIKKIKFPFEKTNFLKLLKDIFEKLTKTLESEVVISVGKIASGLKNVKKSFEQAKTALEIKTIFKNSSPIVKYSELGLARLIDKLPPRICEVFLEEVLNKNKIENLDKDTIYTINKFFENNLNISETSRKLFIHRNTLVYRLEKIKKLTGLDLRVFENATTFKIALMVSKYLNFNLNHSLKI